jgi:adenosylhomocysteine nucleosidase
VKLLVAALESELVAFPAELPGFERLVTGPGKLQATYALTRALDRAAYDEIVVVGTAGSVDPAAVGVHDVTSALQHDVSDVDGIAGQHVSLPATVSIAGREGTIIATGDHFVDDAGTVTAIRALGGTLVDMEAYAYIWVAQQFGVPIRVLKAVSDSAENDAITDWRDAVTACSGQLRERVRELYAV